MSINKAEKYFLCRWLHAVIVHCKDVYVVVIQLIVVFSSVKQTVSTSVEKLRHLHLLYLPNGSHVHKMGSLMASLHSALSCQHLFSPHAATSLSTKWSSCRVLLFIVAYQNGTPLKDATNSISLYKYRDLRRVLLIPFLSNDSISPAYFLPPPTVDWLK